MKANIIVLDEKDNVGVALYNLKKGEQAIYKLPEKVKEFLPIVEEIPLYHKFALRKIQEGEVIYKYGQAIGRATTIIDPGCYVHLHNLISIRNPG